MKTHAETTKQEPSHAELLALAREVLACVRREAQAYDWGPYEKGEVIEIVDTVKMREVHALAEKLLGVAQPYRL